MSKLESAMPTRIMLTLSNTLLEFLDEQSRISGIDRSNLIRAKLVEWRTEERDRRVAEAAAKPRGERGR